MGDKENLQSEIILTRMQSKLLINREIITFTPWFERECYAEIFKFIF